MLLLKSTLKKLAIFSLISVACYIFMVYIESAKNGRQSNQSIVTETIVEGNICCTRLEDYAGPLHSIIKILVDENHEESEATVIKENLDLTVGGAWKPKNCVTKSRVAIIIPYRDRTSHLFKLLKLLFQVLKRQQLDFRIILAEQNGTGVFNKGRINNAAFQYAKRLKVDCVIFHDVDVLPEDDRIPYDCPREPLHLGGRVNTLKYVIWYNHMTGGALAIGMEHYELANGYSNEYWGWGGEDDDFGLRLKAAGLRINRPDDVIGKYTMLKHVKRHRQSTPLVHELLEKGVARHRIDGLCCSNIFTIIKEEVKPLFHYILVDVGEMNPEWKAVYARKVGSETPSAGTSSLVTKSSISAAPT